MTTILKHYVYNWAYWVVTVHSFCNYSLYYNWIRLISNARSVSSYL